MTERFYSELATPVGPMTLVSDGANITAITFQPASAVTVRHGWREDDACLAAAREQLQAYFDGELLVFSLPLAPAGTPFQRMVWAALEKIPYGVTRSYGEIAASIGQPTAARAVGAANGLNPLAIVVPCHRVIGRDGTLTGYAGGLERKSFLLAHEARVGGAATQLQLGFATTAT